MGLVGLCSNFYGSIVNELQMAYARTGGNWHKRISHYLKLAELFIIKTHSTVPYNNHVASEQFSTFVPRYCRLTTIKAACRWWGVLWMVLCDDIMCHESFFTFQHLKHFLNSDAV